MRSCSADVQALSFLENLSYFRSYFRPCLTKLTKLRLSVCPGSPIWPIISTHLKSLGWKYSGFSSSNLGLPSPNGGWEIPGFAFLPTASKGGQTGIFSIICDSNSYRCFIYSAIVPWMCLSSHSLINLTGSYSFPLFDHHCIPEF